MAKTSVSTQREPRARTQRMGKVFVEQKDAALALATSIGEIQEEKSKGRAEKQHHKTTSSSTKGGDSRRKNVPSSSKERLKQAKVALIAEKSRAKKEKAKQKRQARVQTKPGKLSSSSIGQKTPITGTPPPKRVSFA